MLILLSALTGQETALHVLDSKGAVANALVEYVQNILFLFFSAFESRFRFNSIDQIPAPHYVATKDKRYPSKGKQTLCF